MSDHAWVQENITSYATAGLNAEEGERLEKHTARCPDCAGELGQWRGLEQTLEALFASQRPAAGLEDRLIAKLRAAPPVRWWRRLKVLPWAAAVFLGLLGAALHGLVDEGSLPFPGDWSGKTRPLILNSMKQLSLATHNYHGIKPQPTASQDPFLTADVDVDESQSMATRRLEVLTKRKDEGDLAGWADVNNGKKLQKRFREDVDQKGQGEAAKGFDTGIFYAQKKDDNKGDKGMPPTSSIGPPIPAATITPPPTMPSDPRLPPGMGMGGMGSFMGSTGGMGMGGTGIPGPGLGVPGTLPPGPVAKTEAYFKLTTDALDKAGKITEDKPSSQPASKEPPKEPPKEEKKPFADGPTTQKSAEQGKPDNPEPAPVSRKIIRTGEVEFEVDDDSVRIRKKKGASGRGRRLLEAMSRAPRPKPGMTTDELMALTRG